jgi:hypothetical protein
MGVVGSQELFVRGQFCKHRRQINDTVVNEVDYGIGGASK